uniref:ZP domain-containing protein n=1 Tax=Acrobeloides nanus TaxID=290746 RepID=A0A914C671_9BILA
MVHVKWIKFAQLFLLYTMGIYSISIDNDIIGEPDIECLDKEIRVWIKTRKVFAGRIYAKGKADDPDCAKDDFNKDKTKKPHFDLPLGMCGMKSLRSFDPRGMYYGVTLVISFHPLFITKVDQAFHVKCFFEEANRGLTAELGVSSIPTTEVEARHGIPGCTYSIHRSSIEDLDAGKPAGPPIQFARVGDRVLHQWHCDDDMFGVLLNNCYVTDGVKAKSDVIDSRGCPTDPILISGIRYSDDLQRAYAESNVFKFADKPGVWFFCQIQMCMKKDGMCDGITPPSCATVGRTKSVETDNSISENEDGESESGESDQGSSSRNHGRGGKKPKSDEDGNAVNNSEEVEDYNAEELNKQETYRTKPPDENEPEENRRGRGRGRNRGEFADEDGNTSAGGRFRKTTPPSEYDTSEVETATKKILEQNNNIGGYGAPAAMPSTEDYDVTAKEEPKGVTVFGPAFSPMKEAFDEHPTSKTSKVQHSEMVTTEFETADDLATTKGTTTSAPTATKKDSKDLTIPPNLTDLLANLPDDISADSLQKMFRDSVIDRRALLQGFDMLINQMRREDESQSRLKPLSSKSSHRIRQQYPHGRMPGEKIDTMHVAWDSQRMARDLPIPAETTTSIFSTRNLPLISPPDGPPTIAGQLLIYDLDETPPSSVEDPEVERGDCIISRQGLMVLAIGLGSIASSLFFIIFILYLKVRNNPKLQDDFSTYTKNSYVDYFQDFEKRAPKQQRKSKSSSRPSSRASSRNE